MCVRAGWLPKRKKLLCFADLQEGEAHALFREPEFAKHTGTLQWTRPPISEQDSTNQRRHRCTGRGRFSSTGRIMTRADRMRPVTSAPGVSKRAAAAETPDWSALQAATDGRVVLAGSPDYDSLRKPQIARFDAVRPQALVLCHTAEDVAEALSFARRYGLQVAPRSGGHCFAGHSSTEGILIDVTPMRSVSLSNGLVTIGAGARLDDVYDALLEHGLTIPAGCGPSVGIAGLTFGGGLGILGRTYGLTCDHLVVARIVLADGRIITCDERHDEELFWALRGAGARNFGVVTSLVFRPISAPSTTAFHVLWPISHAAAVISAWQSWAPVAPDGLAASLLMTAGGDPDQPPVLKVFGAMLGTEAETLALLDGLTAQAGVEPVSVFCKTMPHRETKRYLASLGSADQPDKRLAEQVREPGHSYSKSEFFRQVLPEETIAALVEHFTKDRGGGQSRELDFTPWGGAYNRVREDATAFVHRNEHFLLKHAVVVDAQATAAERQAAQQWLTRSWALPRPWGSGRVYQNFPDPDLEDWADAYYGRNRDRLVGVKRKYDPHGFFGFGQSIPNNERQ